MRRESTRSEARVWNWLRARRFSAWKFRRQHPIGRYIVDFYSAELKLAIELDGSHHAAEWMIDHESERTNQLRSRGIEILRIQNELLIRDPESVNEFIRAAIERRFRPGRNPWRALVLHRYLCLKSDEDDVI